MQTFGKFQISLEKEYLVNHYIYINEKDEKRDDIKINLERFEELLKNKRKNVSGTIFLYNPTLSPINYNNNSSLKEQGYKFDDKYSELNHNNTINLFSKSIKDGYRGKLIEIKYFFNLNKANIEPTPILEEFDSDLDRYTSSQLTRYDKKLNYQDYSNIRLNGKFVYFASGHKYDRHHKEIIKYARNISTHIQKLGKIISFTHDKNYDADECIELSYFLSPLATGKIKEKRSHAFVNSFKTNPPKIQKLI